MIIAKIENGKLVKEPETAAEQERMRRNFEEMIAAKRGPGELRSDRYFNAGYKASNDHGIEGPEWMIRGTVQMAKNAGIDVAGKVYKPTMADIRGPADPMAWVSDLGDAARKCEATGKQMAMNGHVIQKGKQYAPTPDVPLAEDLIQSNMKDYLQRDPGRAKDLQGLREEIVTTHGAPAAKKSGSIL